MRSAGTCLLVLLLSLFAVSCDEPQLVALQVGRGDEPLPALYWEAPKDLSPAVLLVHMLGRGKEDWVPFATSLRKQGFAVLAIDLREQGRTNAETILADVQAGFQFLRERKKVDAAHIGVVGASIGANAALNLAAGEPLVRLVVLLSPGLNYRGLTTEPAMRDYGARPLLLMAAEEDIPGARAVRRLRELAQGITEVEIYPGRAHGTDLLASGLPVEEEILGFLRGNL